LLICYDFAEAFGGLNLVLKLLVDELFLVHFKDFARQALIRMIIDDEPRNKDIIQGWIEKWHPVAVSAVKSFTPVFDGELQDASRSRLDGIFTRLHDSYGAYLSSMGLSPPE
jgi:hypothetical protein